MNANYWTEILNTIVDPLTLIMLPVGVVIGIIFGVIRLIVKMRVVGV